MSEDKSRWVCHTCKTIYTVGIPPSIQNQLNGLPPSVDLLRTTIRCIETVFDRWGFGRTVNSVVPHLKECMLWRQRHKGHKTEIIPHGIIAPLDYKAEVKFTDKEIEGAV